jgi:hypothetical protein
MREQGSPIGEKLDSRFFRRIRRHYQESSAVAGHGADIDICPPRVIYLKEK